MSSLVMYVYPFVYFLAQGACQVPQEQERFGHISKLQRIEV